MCIFGYSKIFIFAFVCLLASCILGQEFKERMEFYALDASDSLERAEVCVRLCSFQEVTDKLGFVTRYGRMSFKGGMSNLRLDAAQPNEVSFSNIEFLRKEHVLETSGYRNSFVTTDSFGSYLPTADKYENGRQRQVAQNLMIRRFNPFYMALCPFSAYETEQTEGILKMLIDDSEVLKQPEEHSTVSSAWILPNSKKIAYEYQFAAGDDILPIRTKAFIGVKYNKTGKENRLARNLEDIKDWPLRSETKTDWIEVGNRKVPRCIESSTADTFTNVCGNLEIFFTNWKFGNDVPEERFNASLFTEESCNQIDMQKLIEEIEQDYVQYGKERKKKQRSSQK
ncbi:hypothetical protein SH449x_000595 [Pirellulaceae bacterium SH449]